MMALSLRVTRRRMAARICLPRAKHWFASQHSLEPVGSTAGLRLFCDDHRGGMWRYEAAWQSRPSRIGAPDAPGEWLAPAVHRSDEISKAFILFAKGLDGAEPTIAPQRPTL